MAVMQVSDLACRAIANPTVYCGREQLPDGAIRRDWACFENLHGFDPWPVLWTLSTVFTAWSNRRPPHHLVTESGQRPCERGVAVGYGARKGILPTRGNLTLFSRFQRRVA